MDRETGSSQQLHIISVDELIDSTHSSNEQIDTESEDDLLDNDDNVNNTKNKMPYKNGYLIPVVPNAHTASPLINDDLDEHVRNALEVNRYVNVNFEKDPNVNDKCLKLFKDYISKEKSYLLILEILYKEYYETLKSSKFPDLNIDKIFKHIKELYDFYNEIFIVELDARLSKWPRYAFVCDIFVRYIKKIEFYENFVNNFEISFKCLIDYATKSDEFMRFLNDKSVQIKQKYSAATNDTNLEFNDLKSCFIHLLKWSDFCFHFLNAYLDLLDNDSIDFENCKRIWEYLKKLSNKSEEIISDSIKLKSLIHLQKRLGPKCSILSKKRVLLKEGYLSNIRKHLGLVDKLYIVLLNDMVIICDGNVKNENKESLKPKFQLDVIGLRVYDDLASYNKTKNKSQFKLQANINADNIFVVYVPAFKKSLRLLTRNTQEKSKWLQVFRTVETLNKYEMMDIDRQTIGKIAPKWIPDDLCQYCCKCKIQFTTINRRHHCRACGYIFCSRCSTKEVYLKYDEQKKQRICDFCHDIIFQSYRSGPPTKEEIHRRLRLNSNHF